MSPRSTTSAPKLRVFSTFTDEAKRGMTIVAAMPMRWAWYATAWAWLPAETASTPPARSAAVSCAILLNAPRSLNDAVNCRFSNFRNTSQPQIAERVRDSRQGVSPISPRSRAAARSMSAARAGSGAMLMAAFSRPGRRTHLDTD